MIQRKATQGLSPLPRLGQVVFQHALYYNARENPYQISNLFSGRLFEKSDHDSVLKLKEVFGEAFCKSIERTPPFLKKKQHPKTFIVFYQ
ncbi:hypothetical protein HUK81_07890 [Komagataeibacter swingsii]|uniref:Uncharacterized protein n=2 Tax=Komagataeibacter swingsii TaxID=215220 RepID=A0A850NYV0_9PROT|nr:hypothetical protein [Komagataeibacter swingsii]